MKGNKNVLLKQLIFFSLLLLAMWSEARKVSGIDLPIIELNTIDFDQLRLVRSVVGREARTVYCTEEGDRFYKIWGHGFWRAQHFLHCVQCGFYDYENTPLEALIYDRGMCAGYITRGGVVGYKYKPLKKDGASIRPLEQQTDVYYHDFYNDLLKKTKEYQYVYIDLTPFNIAFENEKYRIIDLEPVVPLAIVGKQRFYRDGVFPPDYRAAIRYIAGGRREATFGDIKVCKKVIKRIHCSKGL